MSVSGCSLSIRNNEFRSEPGFGWTEPDIEHSVACLRADFDLYLGYVETPYARAKAVSAPGGDLEGEGAVVAREHVEACVRFEILKRDLNARKGRARIGRAVDDGPSHSVHTDCRKPELLEMRAVGPQRLRRRVGRPRRARK